MNIKIVPSPKLSSGIGVPTEVFEPHSKEVNRSKTIKNTPDRLTIVFQNSLCMKEFNGFGII
jgi:hypothetical protein